MKETMSPSDLPRQIIVHLTEGHWQEAAFPNLSTAFIEPILMATSVTKMNHSMTNSSYRFSAMTLMLIVVLPFCTGGDFSESKPFLSFMESIDPENILGFQWNEFSATPCLHKWARVKCNLHGTNVEEIRLDSLNLSGVIDANSLCQLKHLKVVTLANNRIRGTVPESISDCTKIEVIDLSNNLLSGEMPAGLSKLKDLTRLDISGNHFTEMRRTLAESPSLDENSSHKERYKDWIRVVTIVLGLGLLLVLIYFVGEKAAKLAEEKQILKSLEESPVKMPAAAVVVDVEEKQQEERREELVFFVEEHERFSMDDLLEATADLRNHTICSSLYKVILKDNAVYAVKRLKKLQASFDEFGQTMRRIGSFKHPNILPLIGYNSTNEEKLLIYKYQRNGSLLNLLESYIEGKNDFPWRLRLSIANEIAQGLAFMYRSFDGQETIPHGNLKLSNILLDENMQPQISEYGISRLLDSKKPCLISSKGYAAPENAFSEKGDVFSFGVILLELLTSKSVDKTGMDLPKWVRAMVREEWTGEVFDKEVSRTAARWAFPLLNISLKCVSQSPQDRPSMAEVLEKIEEITCGDEDHDHDFSVSSVSSLASTPQDTCLLHTVIPETWETPSSIN